MRIPMLPMLIVFIFTFFICSIFFYNNSSKVDLTFNFSTYEQGQVLGANETLTPLPQTIASDIFGGLSENNDFVPPPMKKEETTEFLLNTGKAAVLDGGSGAVLFGEGAEQVVPMASITKLVTALVFLDNNPGWESRCRISREDIVEGGRIYLVTGDEVRLKDLFYLSLVGSANTATKALVKATGMSEEEYVLSMNFKAREMGFDHTHFVDPVGFSVANNSTAIEVAKFSSLALAREEIREATLTKNYEFYTLGGRKIVVDNTDILLEIFPQNGIKILGGKTGYTPAAGYCFVGKFTQEGNEIVAVILGSSNQNSRFRQAKKLAEWIYDSYTWSD